MTPLWTVDAMAQAMGAERTGALPVAVNSISIDSRSVGAGDAFFAIKGDNRDGHEFVTAALKRMNDVFARMCEADVHLQRVAWFAGRCVRAR